MSWVLVWLVLAAVETILLVAFAIRLVLHGLAVGRTVGLLNEEAGGLAAEVSVDAARASDRASRLTMRDRTRGRR